jgi:hypothetical protein
MGIVLEKLKAKEVVQAPALNIPSQVISWVVPARPLLKVIWHKVS